MAVDGSLIITRKEASNPRYPRQNPSQAIKPEQKKTKSNKKAVRKLAVRRSEKNTYACHLWPPELKGGSGWKII